MDMREGWAPKNLCFRAVVLEMTPESPLDCKDIKPVNPKGNQTWIFIGRTDVEAEAPILWAPDVRSWLIGNDPDAGKDWRQEEKGMTLDEMVGWHHQLNGHEFEQAPGIGDGQGSLTCCSPWGHKESDTTKRLNWTDWTDGSSQSNEARQRSKSIHIGKEEVKCFLFGMIWSCAQKILRNPHRHTHIHIHTNTHTQVWEL